VCSIINGGCYPAQALLFAYLVTALLLYNISAMQSRADFLSIWWLVIAIIEFFSVFLLTASFGYASEKMVSLPGTNLTVGPTSPPSISPEYHAAGNRIL
jgi:hypothetical protein